MSSINLTISSSALLSPHQLRQNTVWGIGRSLAVTLLYLVSCPVYIGFLGLGVFGVWIMFMTVVLYLQLGFLSLPQAAAKFISENLARHDGLRICQYATSMLGAILVISPLILLLPLVSWPFIFRFSWVKWFGAASLPFLVFLAALVTVQAALAETLGGILAGLGRMDQTYQGEILRQVVTFLISLGLLSQGYQLLALFYGAILAYLLQLAWLVWLIRRSLGFFPLGLRFFSWARLVETARFSGPLLGGALLSYLLQPFNRLLLCYMISPTATAIYEIADRGAQVIRSVTETGLRPYMPRISGLTALADFDQIRHLTVKMVKTVIFWCTPIFFLFFITADQLVAFWLRSSGTAEISFNLRLLLWANFLNLLCVPVYYAFMGLGLVGRCFRIYFLQAVINVPAALLLVWAIGEVWAVSLAATLGISLAALDQICLFFRTRAEAIHLITRGLRALAWPLMFFAPLMLLRQNFPLLLTFGGVAGLLYVLWMNRLGKASESFLNSK
jgi:O-antigen/teichoic acid export membrane protein